MESRIKRASLKADDFLFPSRTHRSPHLGSRQCARMLERWSQAIWLDSAAYGTHLMRRTKAALI